jgi:hypothetical protein
MKRKLPEWKIGRSGRVWVAGEALRRFDLAPRNTEMCDGKLFWNDEERLTMLALLLENVGIDAAVSMGDVTLWRKAVEARELSLRKTRRSRSKGADPRTPRVRSA